MNTISDPGLISPHRRRTDSRRSRLIRLRLTALLEILLLTMNPAREHPSPFLTALRARNPPEKKNPSFPKIRSKSFCFLTLNSLLSIIFS